MTEYKVSEEREQNISTAETAKEKKKKEPTCQLRSYQKAAISNIQAGSKAGCHRKRRIMETWKVLQPRNFDRADAVPVQAQTSTEDFTVDLYRDDES